MVTKYSHPQCSARLSRQWLRRQVSMCITGAAILVMSGCMNAQNTRFPSLYTWYPAAENDAYERTDPFPDPDIGPSMDSTPRGYERPRSESRKAAEQRIFQGMPVGPEYVRPGVPQGRSSDGRVVQ